MDTIDSWGTWQHPHYDGGASPIGQSFGAPTSVPQITAAGAGIYQTGPFVGPALTPDLTAPSTGAGQATTPTGTTTTTSGGFDLSSLTSATIFGIPILWIGLGLAAYFLFFKKR